VKGTASFGRVALWGFVLAAVAASADPPSPPERVPSFLEQLRGQWRLERTEAEPEPPERIRTRDDAVERLTLREAVAVGLENNPAIAAERLGPPLARAEIDRTLGAFDPKITGFARASRLVSPSGSALAGALTLRQRTNDFGATIEKLIRSGATVSASFTSNELDQNSQFLGLRPQYKPELLFSINQPLLRNFGRDLTILLVRSAEAKSEAAYHEYRRQLTAFVRQIVEAYWGIVQARENVKVQEDGLQLARALERENEARVRAGVLPPVAVKEAAAEAARREEQVIVARNALEVATDRLRLLLQRNPAGTFLPREIEPVDRPEVRPVQLDEEKILETALARRPEILAALAEIEDRRLLAKVKRNNLLPELDLEASYGLNALSGRAVPQRDFRTGETRLSPFGGTYAQALDRLFSRDFHSYSAGVTLSLPLANATAEAEYVQSRIDAQRAELRYRDLLSQVTLEVRQAIATVRADSKRITATRLARELAEENLQQQKRRFDVGLATTKDVLDFQEDLTAARAAEIQALIDYNVALAALAQAQGRLLEEFDVVVERLSPGPTPFWARF
jgi:outer membrane protein TolC